MAECKDSVTKWTDNRAADESVKPHIYMFVLLWSSPEIKMKELFWFLCRDGWTLMMNTDDDDDDACVGVLGHLNVFK